MNQFTQQQIEDFKAYDEVRQEGRYNMMSPQAQQLTGLDRNRYLFVLRNYVELAQAAGVTNDI